MSYRLLARAAAFGLLFAATAVAGWGQEQPPSMGAGAEVKPAAQEFDPTGWETKQDYPPLGDPRAKRVPGGTATMVWGSFPPTLRTDGPNSNLMQTRQIHGLMYESLIAIHPTTLDFIPWLASHWKVEKDEKKGVQTFWFHIDPRARWADGSPVTAEDVYASWWHRVQEDRNDPANVMTFNEDYEEPKIVDKLTVKVTTKELNWRLFLYFGGMSIYPAKECRIPGKQYLEDYNWKFMVGSGPYVMKPEDLKKGESLTVTRRNDWWGENEPWGKNTYNFERIKFIVVTSEELTYEKFKKGDLDWHGAGRAQRWVEELPKEEIIKNGWVKMRKIYTQGPQGFSGLCFNMREKPFNDKRMRLAFCHLMNRERLMEKLFFNQYEYMNSYYPGSDWGNGDENEPMDYDPDLAAELLAEVGYSERDSEGYLVGPDGKQLEFTLMMVESPSWERVMLVIKDDFRKAGIKLNLQTLDGATIIQKISERQFKIHWEWWGSLLFPNPETSWRSDLADKQANNNTPGFKNARVDELCKKYNVTFDRAEQKKIIREIDSIIYDEHPYALSWYAPYIRILFWDKFGYPDHYFSKYGTDPEGEILSFWWLDPEREKAMKEAKAAGLAIPQGKVEAKPWEQHGNK